MRSGFNGAQSSLGFKRFRILLNIYGDFRKQQFSVYKMERCMLEVACNLQDAMLNILIKMAEGFCNFLWQNRMLKY